MANKKNSKSIQDKAEREVKKHIKKEAKKTVKKHWKTIAITLAVIALVLIITFVALYILKPDLIQSIIDMFVKPDEEQKNGEDIRGITPIEGEMLEVTVVDVGQGDGIVIEFPDDQIMVIDGGARLGTFSGAEIYEKMDAVLQETAKIKGGSKQIDHLMVTHADYDHLSSLQLLLQNYEVENLHFPRIGDENISKTWNKVHQAALNEEHTNEDGRLVKSNYTENIGNFKISGRDWEMDCYSFKDEDYPNVVKSSSAHVKNEISPICVLTYADRDIVLTGDATIETEEYLLAQENYFKPVDVDVLKVGHHGARESTSQEFLDYIDAEFAIISCAETDYGHPHKELMDRLTNYKDITPDEDWNGFKETYITRDDGNVVVQVGHNGTMNVISTKLEDKNRTDTKVVIEQTSYQIKLYAIINKKEDLDEREYTLNCA